MPSDETPKPATHAPHNHDACKRLTTAVLELAPKDGSLGRRRMFRKEAIVWRSHEPASSLYLLLRGQVGIQFSDLEGRETTVQRIEAGQAFGELCFCSQQRHNVARAVVECQVLEFSYAEFLEFVADNQTVLHALVYAFCERLQQRRGEDRHTRVSRRGAPAGRLASGAGKGACGSDADPAAIVLRVSQEELAQMAAMSRSHVTVTMGRFRSQGLVRYTRDRPVRVNVPALSKYLKHGAPSLPASAP